MLPIADPVRIGIDGYNLAMATGTGVASYGFTLARALAAAGHETLGLFGVDAGRDPALRETLFFDRLGREAKPAGLALAPAYQPWLAARAADVPLTTGVDRRALSHPWPDFARLVTSPRLFALAHRHFATFRRFVTVTMADPPPVMHWTYPVPLRLRGAANIYTLHDLVPLTHPYTTRTAKPTYRALVAACVAHAAHICTVSDTSRAAILHHFPTDPARVTNCYQAVPPTPAIDPAEQAATVAGTLGLVPGGYFLFFGAIEPKKNVGRLIEAHLSRDRDTPLVIVGGKGWDSAGELALLRPPASLGDAHRERLAARVVELGHLPRGVLACLVAQARAVAFPSLAEGFGLPLLEAMALGTPVLTAAGGALAEVAGDAALLVDALDVRAIATGLDRLDHDAALRARLSAAGRVRAAGFSPERFATRLTAMYRAVAPE